MTFLQFESWLINFLDGLLDDQYGIINLKLNFAN